MKKQVLEIAGGPLTVGPYSQAVFHGDTLYIAGQMGFAPGKTTVVSGIEQQTRQALSNLGDVLRAAGLTYSDVVKTTLYMVDITDISAVNAIYREFFPEEPPVRSCVQVSALPKAALIEIEAIAGW